MSEASLMRRAGWAAADAMLMTRRNLLHYVRVPQLIVYTVIQPIMFTLLFVFVFGGAIGPTTQNGSYADYAIPGIVLQTVIFGATGTGIKIAEDVQKGVMDRFRSLPITRGTVLVARVLTDTLWNVVAMFIMVGVGFAVGYRFHGDAIGALCAVGLSILFSLAFSCIAATLGIIVKNAQAAEMVGFTWVFPLVFMSSIFVPTTTMPDWLRGFAGGQPVSQGTNAVRAWSLGTPAGDAWWIAILWCLGIIAVFAPLAVWRFRRMT
ncbi:MAG: ABC transporter permease [bacterium]